MVNGKRLKALREAAGMTTTQLADAVGVNQSMISNMEREFKTPSVEVLVRIAVRLGASLDDLVKKKEA